jgi:hypothetical protein
MPGINPKMDMHPAMSQLLAVAGMTRSITWIIPSIFSTNILLAMAMVQNKSVII